MELTERQGRKPTDTIPDEIVSNAYKKECHFTDEFFCKLNEKTGKPRVLKFVKIDGVNEVRPCCVDDNKEDQSQFEQNRAILLHRLQRMQDRMLKSYDVIERASEDPKLKLDAAKFSKLSKDIFATTQILQTKLHTCLQPVYNSEFNVIDQLPKDICEPMEQVVEDIETAFFPRMFALEDMIATAKSAATARSWASSFSQIFFTAWQALKGAAQGLYNLITTAFNFLWTYGREGLKRFVNTIGPSVRDLLFAVCQLQDADKSAAYIEAIQKRIASVLEVSEEVFEVTQEGLQVAKEVVIAQAEPVARRARDVGDKIFVNLKNALQYFWSATGRRLFIFIAQTVQQFAKERAERKDITVATKDRMENLAKIAASAMEGTFFDSLTLPGKINAKARKVASQALQIISVFSLNALVVLFGYAKGLACLSVRAVLWYFNQNERAEAVIQSQAHDRAILRVEAKRRALAATQQELTPSLDTASYAELAAKQGDARANLNALIAEQQRQQNVVSAADFFVPTSTKKLQTAAFQTKFDAAKEVSKTLDAAMEKFKREVDNATARDVNTVGRKPRPLTSEMDQSVATLPEHDIYEKTENEIHKDIIEQTNDAVDFAQIPDLGFPSDLVAPSPPTEDDETGQDDKGAVINILFKFFFFFAKNSFIPTEDIESKDLQKFRDMKDFVDEIPDLPKVPGYARYTFCRSQPYFAENTEDNIRACQDFRNNDQVIQTDLSSTKRRDKYMNEATDEFKRSALEQLAIDNEKRAVSESDLKQEFETFILNHPANKAKQQQQNEKLMQQNISSEQIPQVMSKQERFEFLRQKKLAQASIASQQQVPSVGQIPQVPTSVGPIPQVPSSVSQIPPAMSSKERLEFLKQKKLAQASIVAPAVPILSPEKQARLEYLRQKRELAMAANP